MSSGFDFSGPPRGTFAPRRGSFVDDPTRITNRTRKTLAERFDL